MPASLDKFTNPAKSLSVMASAGTGKTYLLIKRLARILLRERRRDSVLALTFSERATAELRTRLREETLAIKRASDAELDEWLKEIGESPDGDLRAAAREIHGLVLDRSPVVINTFHSFCRDLNTRFALHNGRASSFDVAARQAALRRQARFDLLSEDRRKLLEKAGLHKAGLEHFLTQLGSDNTLESVLDIIQQNTESLHLYLKHFANVDGEVNINKVAAKLYELALPEPDVDVGRLEGLIRDYAAGLATDGTPKLGKGTAEVVEHTQAFCSAQEVFSFIQKLFLTAKGEWKKTLLSKKAPDSVAKRMEGIQQQIFSDLQEWTNYQLQERAISLNDGWLRLGWCYLQAYQDVKRRRRLIDFDDMQLQAWQLLSRFEDHAAVQQKMSAKISHVLIDEFQDTSLLQWEVIQPFVKEIVCQEHERPSSVFIIGDSKQMIYRFRGAEITLFDRVCTDLSERYGVSAESIDKSYRTGAAILDWLNPVFEKAHMTGFAGFGKHSSARDDLPGAVICLSLLSDKPEEGANGEDGPAPPQEEAGTDDIIGFRRACIDWLDNPQEREFPSLPALAQDDVDGQDFPDPLNPPPVRPHSTDAAAEAEAERMVALLQALMEKRYLIELRGGERRPMQWGDVMLLSRFRKPFPIYERLFEREGIPVLIDHESKAHLAPYAWHSLLGLLQTLLNPHDDIALLTSLCSPLFAITETQLMELAEAPSRDKDKRAKSLWQRLRSARSSASKEAGERMRRARAAIERYITLSSQLPTHDLLNCIYKELDVYRCFCHGLESHRASLMRGHLDNFLYQMLDIQAGRYTNLYRITDELAALVEMQESVNTPLSQVGSDAVRMMTVHQSKGLESPIVALIDANHRTSRSDKYTVLRDVDDQLAVRQLLIYSSKLKKAPLYRELSGRDKSENGRDRLNQCYVTLTRAAQLLIVSATGKPPSKDHKPEFESREESNWYQLIHEAHGLDECVTGYWGDPMRFAEPDSADAIEAESRRTQPRAGPERAPDEADDAGSEADPPASGPTSFGLDRFEKAPSRVLIGQDKGDQARFDGTLVHRVLSLWAPQSQAPAGDAIATGRDAERQIREIIAQERGIGAKERAPSEEEMENAIKLVWQLISNDSLRWIFDPQRYQRAWNEVALLHHDGKEPRQLYIDRLVECDERLWVIDYKMRFNPDDPTFAERKRDYEKQLRGYCHALAALDTSLWSECRSIHCGILSIEDQGLVKIPPSHPLQAQARERESASQ